MPTLATLVSFFNEWLDLITKNSGDKGGSLFRPSAEANNHRADPGHGQKYWRNHQLVKICKKLHQNGKNPTESNKIQQSPKKTERKTALKQLKLASRSPNIRPFQFLCESNGITSHHLPMGTSCFHGKPHGKPHGITNIITVWKLK